MCVCQNPTRPLAALARRMTSEAGASQRRGKLVEYFVSDFFIDRFFIWTVKPHIPYIYSIYSGLPGDCCTSFDRPSVCAEHVKCLFLQILILFHGFHIQEGLISKPDLLSRSPTSIPTSHCFATC